MTNASILLAAFVAVGGFAPLLVWALAAGPFRLSPRAARWWLLGAALGICAQLGFALRVGLPSGAQLALPGLLMLASNLAMRRGVHAFFRTPGGPLEDGILLGAGLLVSAMAAMWPSSSPWQGAVLVLSLLSAWVLGRAAYTLQSQAALELDTAGQRATAWPLWALAGCAAVLGVVLSSPQAAGMLRTSDEPAVSFVLVLSGVVGAVVLNFSLAFLVVMRLIRKLERLSRHDPLTDLMNRRAMEEALESERMRHLRSGHPYTVLMIDVDHFKRINDTYGHAAGDAALVAVADLLRKVARNVDQVARMGGEEFCVLLPETPVAGALQAAERLRMAVERRPARWQGASMAMTISVGVAEADGPDDSVDRLLERADQALYQAKADGRNRVIVARLPAGSRPRERGRPTLSGDAAA